MRGRLVGVPCEVAEAEFSLTVSGLAKVAIFITNVDAENQCLINHKTVCGILNRHFCQTRVSGSLFYFLSVFKSEYKFKSINLS